MLGRDNYRTMSVSFHICVTGRPAKWIMSSLCLSVLLGCSSASPPPSVEFSRSLSVNEQKVRNQFERLYSDWRGVPYRLGGDSYSGIDCSAFVQVAYRDVRAQSLPRTTRQQVKVGDEVSYADAQVGDLVFFKTAAKVYHVGVYMGNMQFMHASTSKGVIISRLDNPYWASKYWHIRRVNLSPTPKG